jgi:hypothetical protein
VEALELARAFGSADRQARAVLGMGGRFYAPVATDVAYAELLAEALGVLGTDDSALRVRLLARLAENLVLTQPEQARRLADEALGMARRLAEPGSLASALMGRHAALLHVAYASERSRIGEELVAVAGELEDPALAALARHWLLYDLAELGEIGHARQRQAELERIADELQQPLYRHSALAWRGVWAGLEGRFEEAERLARESVRLAQGAGARDAQTHFTAQLVAIRREQGRLDEVVGDPELGAQLDSGRVAGHERVRAVLDARAGERLGCDLAAEALTCFEEHDLLGALRPGEFEGGAQPRDSATHDHDAAAHREAAGGEINGSRSCPSSPAGRRPREPRLVGVLDIASP